MYLRAPGLENGMQIKICGITRLDDALSAAELGADFVGLILAHSARRVSLEFARRVARAMPEPTRPVLVFRGASLAEIVDAVGKTNVQHVQLHGYGDIELVEGLRRAIPELRIIRAWEIEDERSSDSLRSYLSGLAAAGVDIYRVIVDTPKTGRRPPSGAFAALMEEQVPDHPGIWRAGGLTADSVTAALAEGRFVGVDVAGGVESAPGLKDVGHMRRFIAAVRSATGP